MNYKIIIFKSNDVELEVYVSLKEETIWLLQVVDF